VNKRKSISPKIRLEVLKRDNYTCRNCGKSPAKYPELDLDVVELEIDHFQPVSKNGDNRLDNLQTLCRLCNRGKGNDEQFNITINDKIRNLLDAINPLILVELSKSKAIKVVANDNDFQELLRLTELTNKYRIQIIPNTFIGYHAGFNMGVYTIKDYGGSKVNFLLEVNDHSN
jgi:3-dehydroquinate dehydratase